MKHGFIKLGVAIPELRVADCAFNTDKIIELSYAAAEQGALVLAFSELSITGYTCGDLFFRETLLRAAEQALAFIADKTDSLDTLIAVGLPVRLFGKLYNCAAVLQHGNILGIVPKSYIPSYGEFSEGRRFDTFSDGLTDIFFAGQNTTFGVEQVFEHAAIDELKVAVEICEDALGQAPVSTQHCVAGATVILNLSASPEAICKPEYRRDLLSMHSARNLCVYAYANSGSGESTTDLVFSGHSFVLENGKLLAENEPFGEKRLVLCEVDVKSLAYARSQMNTFVCERDRDYSYTTFDTSIFETNLTREFARRPFVPDDADERVKRTDLTMKMQSAALAKRVMHTGAKSLVLGVSGGLDSTLAILVCVEAMKRLGRPMTDIHAVTMPCFGTGKRTRTNAELLCERLGVGFECIDITASVKQHLVDIGHDENTYDVTFENAQARERTQVLMDLANSRGGLVVGTGDLSEVALGWSTYNGDHMSMYSVNCSIPKTFIRCMIDCYAQNCSDQELCAVLYDILDTPISPELVPSENAELSQKTEELIGDYDLHDFFLYYFVRAGYTPEKLYRIAKLAFDRVFTPEHIKKTLRTFVWRFFSQQFKRSCCPDGVKVGSVALSVRGDLQMPSDAVAAEWLEQIDNIDAD